MHKKNIKRLTVSAVLSALAIVVVFINFSIFPQVPYLKYDMGDVPILIISFLFGPLYGFLSTVIVAAFSISQITINVSVLTFSPSTAVTSITFSPIWKTKL